MISVGLLYSLLTYIPDQLRSIVCEQFIIHDGIFDDHWTVKYIK